MRDQHGKIADALRLRLPYRHGIGRRRGLKANREEYNFSARIRGSDPHRVQRRINDANVASLGLHLEQIAIRAGNAQHVAERAEDDVGPPRDGMRAIDHIERRYADRTSWAVHQLDFLRQKIVQPVFDDRVRLTAADLHEGPRTCDGPLNFRDQLLCDGMIAVFVDVLHVSASGGPSSGSGASISCN